MALVAALAMAIAMSGCVAGVWARNSAGGGTDYATGEAREVEFPAEQSFVLTQDVLRQHGILFDVKPDRQIITFWKPADTPASLWGSLIGVEPRYRYEIQVVPEGDRRSKIIANVRADDIAGNDIDSYKASRRINLFTDFGQLAMKTPPPSTTPRSGGVNFALLPGEDLKALAKRVTGNPDNWSEIAKDNGLKSPTDTAGVQSVWVADSLLPHPGKTATPGID